VHDTNRTTAIRQEADNYRTSLSRLRPVGGAMKIRWLPALLILAVVAAAIRLGFWQRDRAHQKEALQADIVRYGTPRRSTWARSRLRWRRSSFTACGRRPLHARAGGVPRQSAV
jgi:hypothetical protein